jgi:hypothetical protein
MDEIQLLLTILLIASIAGLAAYVKVKAEHLARKEDFLQLLAQQKQTAKELEEIKTSITHDVWLKQRRWEVRKETYGTLLSLFQGLQFQSLERAIEAGMTPPPKGVNIPDHAKVRRTFVSPEEATATVTTSMFLVSKEAYELLQDYMTAPTADDKQEYSDYDRHFKAAVVEGEYFQKLLHIARKEFGEDI